jgi:hypothetical protein
MEEKLLDDLTLRELADLLRSKLAAKEKKAESTAVLVQPVVVVLEAPTPSTSLLLADLLTTKFTAIEKKEEYAAVLVQTVVVVPEAPTPSALLLLVFPTLPLPRKQRRRRLLMTATAATVYTPSTNGLPSVLWNASEKNSQRPLANH